jgi:predicted N-formylglutamate amidohydrolase
MQSKVFPLAGTVIEAVEAPAVSVIAGCAASGLVLLCDHASNALPDRYGCLGLASAQFERHIAYDIGAAPLTRLLAAELGCPAILTRYSRLLIDCNRGTDDPTLIMRLSDGAIIPGNRVLDAAERAERIANYYNPYHGAIRRLIDRLLTLGMTPVLLSIHSFTPQWRGRPRPWHAGVLWDKDNRLALPMLELLRGEAGLSIGDNEPYSGRLKGDTLWQHGTRRGIAHAIIEVRQDLIADPRGQREWAARLASVMRRILEDGEKLHDLRQIRYFGSHTDDAHASLDRLENDQDMTDIDEKTRVELEAATYRRLVEHLRARTDVQNIDLMNLAGFCRNCLANWYQDAANARGITLTKEGAREIVYGMPYAEWQAKNQKEASPEKLAAYEKARPKDH